MDELNEARRSSSVPEPEVPDTSETPEKEAPEEPEEYLTPEDKQFLKKLILSVKAFSYYNKLIPLLCQFIYDFIVVHGGSSY